MSILGRGWIKDAFWIASATVVSRLLGLVREVVVADQFGAGGVYDAYLIAFFIPHFLRRLLAEGALSNAFIPIYKDQLRQNRAEADQFASTVLSAALIVFPIVVIFGELLAPFLVPLLADGFSQTQQVLAIELSYLTFPFIALIGLAAIVMGILNSHGQFFGPAFAPVMLNVGIIVSVLVFRGLEATSLAIGVLLGGSAQLLMQLPLLKGKFKFRWHLNFKDESFQQMLKLLLPGILGLAVVQINVLVDNKLASHLEEGSISALQFAIRLFQLPLGVFAVAISTAIFPRLSGEPNETLPPLRQGVLLCALILMPASVGLWLLAEGAIQLLFEHGRFTIEDTARTLNALQFYVIGMVPYGLVAVLTRAFYSLKDGKSPVFISAISVAVNVVLALLLIDVMGVGGLALSTSVAGWVQLALTWIQLSRSLKGSLIEGISQSLIKSLLATSVMGVGVWGSLMLVQQWTVNEFVLVSVPTLVGVLVYSGFVWKDLKQNLEAV